MSGIKIGDNTLRNLEDQVGYLTATFQSGKLIDELGIKVLGVFPTLNQAKTAIPGPYVYGEAFQIGTEIPYNLYIFTRNIEDFFNFGPFPAPGKDGTPASFGSITATINAQEGTPQVTVTKSGPDVQPDLKFNFFNLKGPEGRRGTIKIGTTITGQVGKGASVVNVGTDNDAILQFTIPKGETGAQGPAFNIYGTLDSTSQLPTPTEALRDAGAAYIIPNAKNEKHLWVIQGPESGNLEWVDIGVAAAGPVGPSGKDGVGVNTITQIRDIGTPVVTYDTDSGMTINTTDRITYTQNGESVTHDTALEREIPIVFGQGLTADSTVEADKINVKANIVKIQDSTSVEFTPDENGVVTIPKGSHKNLGLLGIQYGNNGYLGLTEWTPGYLSISAANKSVIDERSPLSSSGEPSGTYKPIVPGAINYAVKAALTDDKRIGTETSGINTAFTDTEKDRACEILGATRTNGFKTLFGNQNIVGSGNIDIYKHTVTATKAEGSEGWNGVAYFVFYSSNNLNINSVTDLKTILGESFIQPCSGYLKESGDVTTSCELISESGFMCRVSTGTSYDTIPFTYTTFTDTVTTI